MKHFLEFLSGPILSLTLAAFVVSIVVTGLLIAYARRKNLLQPVNGRSMHSTPTPVGGGWAVLIGGVLVWALVLGQIDERNGVVLFGALCLALMSWVDDLRPLPARSRLGLQIVAVCCCLYFIPSNTHILSSYLPLTLDRMISAVCWLWFINLFNFMDGMDGLAGSETVSISVGVLIVGGYVGMPSGDLYLALLIGAAMAGFLFWNWHPAKIFLGDVGSIPMGFLLGWLLINLAAKGALLAALILPAYFLFDATLTITRRLLKREKIWEAHRQHLYQKAALSGLSHSQVVLRILPTNLLLMYSAYVSLVQPVLGFGLAVIAIALVVAGLFYLEDSSGPEGEADKAPMRYSQ